MLTVWGSGPLPDVTCVVRMTETVSVRWGEPFSVVTLTGLPDPRALYGVRVTVPASV